VKKVLEMKFKNGSGKEVAILVSSPKENLTAAAVTAVMESMIAKNIFATSSGDLVKVVGAHIKITDVGALA
jgi:hypothetical protein